MSQAAWFIVVVFALAAAYFAARIVIPVFNRYRGKRLITCPENQQPAAVEVDAMHAAVTAGIGEPMLDLKSCTRWPGREDCGRECLRQIEASPEACLVRSVATRWYAGKTCAYCGKPFGQLRWAEHQPALLGPDGKTVQWNQLAPESLPGVLATHRPVCWDCHIVETVRNQHPNMVVERPAH